MRARKPAARVFAIAYSGIEARLFPPRSASCSARSRPALYVLPHSSQAVAILARDTMKTSLGHSSTREKKLLDLVRSGTSAQRERATDRLMKLVIPALPASVLATPIDRVRWSQTFVTNGWWQGMWRQLGVARVADLAGVGRALAKTRGVGRTKLRLLVEDLMQMNGRTVKATVDGTPLARLVETIRHHIEVLEHGSGSPRPQHVAALFQSIVAALPNEIRCRPIDAFPWESGWCYTTRAWSELNISVVADLATAAAGLAHVRGIGRSKLLTLAEELMLFCPELHALLRLEHVDHKSMVELGSKGQRSARSGPHTVSIAEAIDRLALRLAPRERDVLHRRIGWRYHRSPEKLRTLATAHDVTQERIRQIEGQLRKRLGLLVRLHRFPEKLRKAAIAAAAPVALDSVVACGRLEFRGMMEVWRPLGSLLEEAGGPYLLKDPRQGDRVVVSLTPSLPADCYPPKRRRSPGDALPEPGLPCPTSTPRSPC
jgi:hypothetical protein